MQKNIDDLLLRMKEMESKSMHLTELAGQKKIIQDLRKREGGAGVNKLNF